MTTVDLLKKIYFYMGVKERIFWGVGIILATLSAIIGLFLPTQLNLLVQNFKNFDSHRILLLILLFISQNVIMYSSLYILGKSGEYMILSLRKESILTLIKSETINLKSTSWASRIIYNSSFFSDLISRQLPTLVTQTLQLSLTMIILLFLNFKVTMLMIFGILFIMLYSIISGKFLSKIQIRTQEFLSATTQQLSDVFGRLRLMKINNATAKEYQELRKSIQDIYRLSLKNLRASIVNQVGHQLMFILLSIFILFIIINDIRSGVLQLSSVTLYIVYCFQLAAPLLTITEELTGIKKSKEVMVEYLDKVNSLVSNSELRVYAKFGNKTQIEISNYFNPFNKKYIKSLQFHEGSVYQLIGASGVGKTTLLNSILGLVQFSTGLVHVTLKSEEILYNRIAYYQSQQQILINKSIRENLSYSHQIPDSELLHTLQQFGLSEELQSYDILNLIVTEKTLSKGQISRLALAREYLKRDSEIVILDEPYAHLDEENSLKIDKMFRDRFNSSIIIIVSHTKNYYQKKDYIIEMV